MERTEKQERQRLYYLHEQVKKRYEIDTKEKRVYVPNFDAIPEPFGGYISELQRAGYAIQLATFPVLDTATIGTQRISRIAKIFAGAILANCDNFGINPPEALSLADFNAVAEEVKSIGARLVFEAGLAEIPKPDTRAGFMKKAVNTVLKINS